MTGVIKSTLCAGFWICLRNRLVKLWNLGKVSVGVKPEYFSMEMVLRTNLGPLHLLDSLIQDDSKNSYLRKEARISQIVSKDIHKSASIASFQRKTRKNPNFPQLFAFLLLPKRVKTVFYMCPHSFMILLYFCQKNYK